MGGRSTAIMEANLLKQAGVEIYGIGISDSVREELLYSIASTSNEGNPKVFILENYASMHSLVQHILKGEVDYSQCGLTVETPGEIHGVRILDGKKSEEPWPWMAALFMPYMKSDRLNTGLHCGGSIINEKFILTAAHCMYYSISEKFDKEDIKVKLGLTDIRNETYLQEYEVDEIFIHPKYRRLNSYDYDIALLQLDRKIVFHAFIRPICLPSKAFSGNFHLYRSNELALAIGWGHNRILAAISRERIRARQYLKEILLPIQPTERCIQSLVDNKIHASYFTSRMFCAGYGRGGNDTCKGDSGGPIMQSQLNSEGYPYWTQVGITSWGIGCGLKNTYGYYSHVQRLRTWIDNTILKALAADEEER